MSAFISTFSLKLTKPGTECETDLCAIVDGKGWSNALPEMVIGECKSAGGVIDREDIDNLVAVAEDLQKLQVEPFIIFAKTSDAFKADEIERFKVLQRRGLGFVLLTNRELECIPSAAMRHIEPVVLETV